MTRRLQSETSKRALDAYVFELFASGSADEILAGLGEMDVPLPYNARPQVIASEFGVERVMDDLHARGVVGRLSKNSISFRHTAYVGVNKDQVNTTFALVHVP